ncbi:helix-turn-helix domain-containing protein [Saccharopolyspora sp. MS10]|uniref:helix-turn-helix domain-containing protein n=1 Tax=Saccharopolyspora sp. MS10 TaxID=3385973 RepID=UPI0039A08480
MLDVHASSTASVSRTSLNSTVDISPDRAGRGADTIAAPRRRERSNTPKSPRSTESQRHVQGLHARLSCQGRSEVPKFAGSQARAIGAEIRRARDSLDWTLDQLASATDISRSTLSRIETGARRPGACEVASILTALSVTGNTKERLIRLAGDEAGTWVGIGTGMAQQLSAVAAYEAEAHSIHEFQISVFPGLLQTAAYANALIATSPLGSAARDRAVFTRVERQSALSRTGLRHYAAFVDEAALRRRAGTDPRLMADQLLSLIKANSAPTNSIRVLPFTLGAYWGCEGPFTLYSLHDDHHVVYQENAGSGVFIDDRAAETYVRVLRNLEDIALDAQESNALLAEYAERYAHVLRVPQEQL